MLLNLLGRFACLSLLAYAHLQSESSCENYEFEHHSIFVGEKSLLQIAKSASAVSLVAKNQGEACQKLEGRQYISGSLAVLNEDGYRQTAELCCHHEMSLFVRREIDRQGFDICDLADLHGFVHWYDCSDDLKTYNEMRSEIAAASSNNCPWLGRLPNCPVKGPNCRDFTACGRSVPPDSLPGSSAPLSQAGYVAVAKICCHVEMEQFVLREIDRQGLYICNEGGLQGFLHWYDCSNDGPTQTYAKMQQEIRDATGIAGSLSPCPWLGKRGEPCPRLGQNCPWVEGSEPAAHRRRTACR